MQERLVLALRMQHKTPAKARTVSLTTVHKRFLRLDIFYDEIVVGTETVVGYSVARLELLPCGVDSARCVHAGGEEALEGAGEIPAATGFAKLEDPGPDGGGRGVDKGGLVIDHGGVGDDGVAGVGAGGRRWGIGHRTSI